MYVKKSKNHRRQRVLGGTIHVFSYDHATYLTPKKNFLKEFSQISRLAPSQNMRARPFVPPHFTVIRQCLTLSHVLIVLPSKILTPYHFSRSPRRLIPRAHSSLCISKDEPSLNCTVITDKNRLNSERTELLLNEQ